MLYSKKQKQKKFHPRHRDFIEYYKKNHSGGSVSIKNKQIIKTPQSTDTINLQLKKPRSAPIQQGFYFHHHNNNDEIDYSSTDVLIALMGDIILQYDLKQNSNLNNKFIKFD